MVTFAKVSLLGFRLFFDSSQLDEAKIPEINLWCNTFQTTAIRARMEWGGLSGGILYG